VLDSYFNFTKKSNLVGNLYCDFLKNWWWLTFLGPRRAWADSKKVNS